MVLPLIPSFHHLHPHPHRHLKLLTHPYNNPSSPKLTPAAAVVINPLQPIPHGRQTATLRTLTSQQPQPNASPSHPSSQVKTVSPLPVKKPSSRL
ncbi:hypothetical protein BC829DRAFT_175286 [Chytridium lagenaria]|nr:hypothetical protein BC829DRAFT_175286 [Chytridium lagenaria]